MRPSWINLSLWAVAIYFVGILAFSAIYCWREKVWVILNQQKRDKEFEASVAMGFAWPIVLVAAIAIYFEKV